MQLFKVADLYLKFGGKTILKDVSFQFEKGMDIGLICSNIAGKISLIKVNASLVLPEGDASYQQNEKFSTNKINLNFTYL